MKTIRHDLINPDYCLVKEESNVSQYAVLKWTGNFWQQVSPWYFRKGNAVRKYESLIKKENAS